MTRSATRWRKCPACGAFLYDKRLARDHYVCSECKHHLRLSLSERMALLFDDGSVELRGADIGPRDVLGFVDSLPYPTRLERAQRKTGQRDAARYGTAAVDGRRLVFAVLDFAFMGGSMGAAVGEAVTRAAELALAERLPLLLVTASGGARMQEGAISLMQMAKTSQALARLHEAGVLVVCLVTDPTFGGVSASFATLGDVLVAEPGCRMGFAGPTVIAQTIAQELPPGFQTAEFLLEHGMLDLVEPREGLRARLAALLDLTEHPVTTWLPQPTGPRPIVDPSAATDVAPSEVLALARHRERPTTLDYVAAVFDDFVELHGDRIGADDPAIVGGLARLGDVRLVVVGHQKGHSTTDLVARNFGMPQPEGYRKARRLFRLAAKLGLPVVTLIDTPGAYPGVAAEEHGQSVAIAEAIMELSRLPVPVVAVVTGEGGSGGALALGVADRVLVLEHGFYSVISPEGCSTILWHDASKAVEAAAALRLTAPDLLRLGVVDGIVPEPAGGAHCDPGEAAANVQTAIIEALGALLPETSADLVARRYRRFRAFGTAAQPLLEGRPHELSDPVRP
ncbi:MAG TPA: acetyl-CoA carboxylase carboxyltransferase subunit alpha [Egibacteraceae bacterium]